MLHFAEFPDVVEQSLSR